MFFEFFNSHNKINKSLRDIYFEAAVRLNFQFDDWFDLSAKSDFLENRNDDSFDLSGKFFPDLGCE